MEIKIKFTVVSSTQNPHLMQITHRFVQNDSIVPVSLFAEVSTTGSPKMSLIQTANRVSMIVLMDASYNPSICS